MGARASFGGMKTLVVGQAVHEYDATRAAEGDGGAPGPQDPLLAAFPSPVSSLSRSPRPAGEEDEEELGLSRALIDNLNLLVDVLDSVDSHIPLKIPQAHNAPVLLRAFMEKETRIQWLRKRYEKLARDVSRRMSELGLSQMGQQSISHSPSQPMGVQGEIETPDGWA